MFRDWIDWAIMGTTLVVPKMYRGHHTIRKFSMSESIIWFISSFPVVIRVGIKGDVYSLFAVKEVRIPGFEDLGALAILAGWNQPTTYMPSLHARVLGAVLNLMVFWGDSTWGSRWGAL